MLGRPEASEYAPYYQTYVGKVPEGDIVELMEIELAASLDLLRSIPEQRETWAYAEGKWSIREVVGHVLDAERVFGYRALAFARGDVGPLPTMEQDDWARVSNAGSRPLGGMLDELAHMRRAHKAMFESFDETIGLRRGVASGCEFTVRAIAYIVVGHEIHHRRVLRERYLSS